MNYQDSNEDNIHNSLADKMDELFLNYNQISSNLNDFTQKQQSSKQSVSKDEQSHESYRFSFQNQQNQKIVVVEELETQEDQKIEQLLKQNEEFNLDFQNSHQDQQNSFSFNKNLQKEPVNFIYSTNSQPITPDVNSTGKSSMIVELLPKEPVKSLFQRNSEVNEENIHFQKKSSNPSQEEITTSQENQIHEENYTDYEENQENSQNQQDDSKKMIDSSNAYNEVKRVYFNLKEAQQKSIFEMTNVELMRYHQQMEQVIKKNLLNMKQLKIKQIFFNQKKKQFRNLQRFLIKYNSNAKQINNENYILHLIYSY